MRQIVLSFTLSGGRAAGNCGRTAEEPVMLTKKDIAKLMKDAHTGREVAARRTLEELGKVSPDWDQLSIGREGVRGDSRGVQAGRLGSASPAKYTESATCAGKGRGARRTRRPRRRRSPG